MHSRSEKREVKGEDGGVHEDEDEGHPALGSWLPDDPGLPGGLGNALGHLSAGSCGALSEEVWLATQCSKRSGGL